jgi:hypothetical protein
MDELDLDELLNDLDDDVRAELASKPDVVDKGHQLDLSDLPIEKRCWYKVRDVVAVVADLKAPRGSASISMPPQQPASTKQLPEGLCKCSMRWGLTSLLSRAMEPSVSSGATSAWPGACALA